MICRSDGYYCVRMEPYRVKLDVYNGPLDLLLYLIRRDEVDIYDIPIAHVTEQYCRYVELIHQVDPNLAGEFLVLAATLLEIKTRMLLPVPPPGEEAPEQGLGDPRTELVRQLLEYKAFKDAAGELRLAAENQAMRFPRSPAKPDLAEPELELENIQVWHLLEAFNKLMASIGRTRAAHEVVYDDTPIALHATDILDRLQRQGNLTFRQVFEGRAKRSEIVGLFLAMLELIRQKRIVIQQEEVFEEIYLFLRTGEPDTGEAQGEDPMIAFNEQEELQTVANPEVRIQRDLISAAGAMLEEIDTEADTSVHIDHSDRLEASVADALLRSQKEEEDEDEWEDEEEEDDDLDLDEDDDEDEDEDEDELEEEEDLDEEELEEDFDEDEEELEEGDEDDEELDEEEEFDEDFDEEEEEEEEDWDEDEDEEELEEDDEEEEEEEEEDEL